MRKSLQQLSYLFYETQQLNNQRWWRWLGCWFTNSFWAIACYRIERACYLLLGRGWSAIRILISPVLFFLHPWFGQADIHYRAEIGMGLKILHPQLGIVINGNAVIGDHCTLTGGNCIGGRKTLVKGSIRLGNHVSLGANAVVLGPVIIGDNVNIGAGAVVINDAPDNCFLVGVPAVEKRHAIK
jgi:serine acetyltransferase